MAVKFKISAFDVHLCGYYRRGQKVPEFGSLEDILPHLKQWAGGKSFRQTKLFEPNDGMDALPVYCFNLHPGHQRKSWLLTTWNETPMSDGKVQAARGSAPVGQVDVSTANVAPDHIPGFPTYFLFLPEQGLAFSLRPDGQQHNGHRGMVNFVDAYLRLASPYVVLNAGDDANPDVDNEILGYRKEQESPHF